MSVKKPNIETLVFKLLAEKPEISLGEVARASGLSKTDETDRKAIRRVLNALIARGLLQAKGAARARVYTANSVLVNVGAEFEDIPLTPASQILWQYISQSMQARTPVGYNQDFLRSYQPNKTFYLSAAQRMDLLVIGTTGNQEAGLNETFNAGHNSVYLAGTYARSILNRLFIDLSWNSSRLEGNTYSLLETKRLLELGESAAGKNIFEAQMIINHKAAIEYIIESVAEEKISMHTVCSIHALLSENLLGDSSASGRMRNIAVNISGTTYMPSDNPHILQEYFQLFIDKLNCINDPFEQSFFALVHLSYIQAFEDVNKRTARLVANIPLIKNNLKPFSFTDIVQVAYVKSLIGVYEQNDVSLLRDLYIWAYRRSAQKYSAIQQGMGEPNLLKLKYRTAIQEIMRTIILEKVEGRYVVSRIRNLMQTMHISDADAPQLFQIIETEILNLHEGNIARFKIRPSEFQEWKGRQ